MKKIARFVSIFMFVLGVGFALAGCQDNTTGATTASTTTSGVTQATTTSGAAQATTTTVTTSVTTPTTDTTVNTSPWFLAGNFSGYVPNDEDFRMSAVEDNEGWYTITVSLTVDNRDNAYDGHYYKVTDGTWTVCYGTEKYALQPAPVSPTGGGLGSIWVYENMELTVLFDANTLTIYDNSMVDEFSSPRIYGDFNTALEHGSNWGITEDDALVLLDDNEDGIYEGEWTFPAYDGTGEFGYSFAVAIQAAYYINEWGNYWGVTEQYLFDGSSGGMGLVSYLNPGVETTYHFAYDSTNNVTTVTTTFANPIIYGDFSAWSLFSEDAIVLEQSLTDENLYVGTLTLDAYTGEGDGYMLAVSFGAQLYYWEGVGTWGATTQYLFDGSSGGMGLVSYLKPTDTTTYVFSYNNTSHVTTVTIDLISPIIYGDFSSWSLSSETAIILTQDVADENLYIGTATLPAYTGEGLGYMMALCTQEKLYYWEGVGTWGAGTQYLFSGDNGGMGKVTYLNLSESMELTFTYNVSTNITEITPPTGKSVAPFELLSRPTLYGTFTRETDDSECWILEGEDAAVMTLVSGETTLYEITLTLDTFVAPTDGYYTADLGYRFILVTTKANIGWGYYAGEQYLLNGSPAGMGAATIITVMEDATYRFVYDSLTHITTYSIVE